MPIIINTRDVCNFTANFARIPETYKRNSQEINSMHMGTKAVLTSAPLISPIPPTKQLCHKKTICK